MTTRPIEKLRALRAYGGERRTVGLPDEVLSRFLERDGSLSRAVDEAWE